MDFSEIELFKNEDGTTVTFDELLKDIYTTSRRKKTALDSLTDNISAKIKTANDAAVLGPIVAEYVQAGIKNDDQLVKLAQVIQRATMRIKPGGDADGIGGLSEEEKRELMQAASEILEKE